MLVFLYLMAYIDKTNIGNAKIEGLTSDLNMKGIQYNVAVAIFFIPFILFGQYEARRLKPSNANGLNRGSLQHDSA